MKKAILTLIPIGLLLAGCETTGLSPRDQQNSYALLINSVYQNAPQGNKAKSINTPIHLAVAQIGETAPQSSFLAELKKKPELIRDITSLPMPSDSEYSSHYQKDESKETISKKFSNRIESARNLANDMGAGYLLLVGGGIDTYDSRNLLAPLDITIVGGAVFPSVKVHADGKASAALLDVETGRILILSNAENKTTGLTPSWFTDDKKNVLRESLREELLRNLAVDVLKRLQEKKTEAS